MQTPNAKLKPNVKEETRKHSYETSSKENEENYSFKPNILATKIAKEI